MSIIKVDYGEISDDVDINYEETTVAANTDITRTIKNGFYLMGGPNINGSPFARGYIKDGIHTNSYKNSTYATVNYN